MFPRREDLLPVGVAGLDVAHLLHDPVAEQRRLAEREDAPVGIRIEAVDEVSAPAVLVEHVRPHVRVRREPVRRADREVCRRRARLIGQRRVHEVRGAEDGDDEDRGRAGEHVLAARDHPSAHALRHREALPTRRERPYEQRRFRRHEHAEWRTAESAR